MKLYSSAEQTRTKKENKNEHKSNQIKLWQVLLKQTST